MDEVIKAAVGKGNKSRHAYGSILIAGCLYLSDKLNTVDRRLDAIERRISHVAAVHGTNEVASYSPPSFRRGD